MDLLFTLSFVIVVTAYVLLCQYQQMSNYLLIAKPENISLFSEN